MSGSIERHRATSDRLGSDAGVTLIETAFASAILLVVMTGLMSVMGLATALTENDGHLAARAAEYAQDKMEQLLALSYSDAAGNTTVIPTVATGGSGLALGGSSNPNAVAAE